MLNNEESRVVVGQLYMQ